MTNITPTIGRKIYYFVRDRAALNNIACADITQPFDVNIVFVHSPTLINIAGFDHYGAPFARHSVPINDGGAEKHSAWCEWMPFQQGQAKAQSEAK